MNWNVTSTGTVVGEPTAEGGAIRASVLAISPYRDAEGETKYRNLMFYLAFRDENPNEVMEFLEIGARVAFEGYFTGPPRVNEHQPTKETVNGPKIYFSVENDEPYTALNVKATQLRKIGAPVKKPGEGGIVDVTTVVLWGFLGRDYEQRYTPSGNLVTKSSMAVNRFYYTGEGDDAERHDVTVWWNLDLWGARGETAAKFWKKGEPFVVKGVPSVDNKTGAPGLWQTTDGEWRASYQLNVHTWDFSPSKRGGGVTESDENYSEGDMYDDDEIPF